MRSGCMKETNAREVTRETYKEISIRDVLSPVFRRKRILKITFVAIFLLVVGFSALKGPTYTSHMEVLVNRERQDPLVTTQATTQMIPNSTPVAEEEINSRSEEHTPELQSLRH